MGPLDRQWRFSYVVRQDNSQSWTVNSSQTHYTLDWMSPGRTYSFYVYAVDNQLNVSGNSNTVTVTTDPDLIPPSAPRLVRFQRQPVADLEPPVEKRLSRP